MGFLISPIPNYSLSRPNEARETGRRHQFETKEIGKQPNSRERLVGLARHTILNLAQPECPAMVKARSILGKRGMAERSPRLKGLMNRSPGFTAPKYPKEIP